MWLYNLGISIYAGAIGVASLWHEKARLWYQGRKGLLARMRSTIRPSDRIVWVHAASLGEFEQGRPLIEKIREEHPEYKILLTFFSPSGYEIRKNYAGADYVFYLPADTPRNARRFLDIIRPEIAVFVKYEFWINLLRELRTRHIRTYIVSAIFRRNSVFFRPYGSLWREALETFETIFVQNEESRTLLAELGFDNVVTAGDTRFDRVAGIAAAARKIPAVERLRGEGRLFVAGSTWQPDEELLLQLANDNPSIKFVIAPHEMNDARIERFIAGVRGGAIRYTAVAEDTDLSRIQVMILDTMGMLSSVYGYATWAYIGGGFGAGIHNTLEAAIFALPIAFGPKYLKFKEARDMVSLGACTPVASCEELSAWFAPLRDDEQALLRASRAAKDYTTRHIGASDIIIRTIFGK